MDSPRSSSSARHPTAPGARAPFLPHPIMAVHTGCCLAAVTRDRLQALAPSTAADTPTITIPRYIAHEMFRLAIHDVPT